MRIEYFLKRSFVNKNSSVFHLFVISKSMGTQTKGEELSDLSKIEDIKDDPIDLFRTWHTEARKNMPNSLDVCCVATVSKDMKVSARTVVLREFDNEGFVLVTDNRSKKVKCMESVPSAAMCFLWNYVNSKGQNIARQVRVEGNVKRLDPKDFKHLYDREPLFCKIRSHLCCQDAEVDWNEMKKRHDEIFDEYCQGKNNLTMPDHFIGYKLLPTMVEFYYARDHLIGDRIQYKRNSLADPWEYCRLAV